MQFRELNGGFMVAVPAARKLTLTATQQMAETEQLLAAVAAKAATISPRDTRVTAGTAETGSS
jgi:hypothetical protein